MNLFDDSTWIPNTRFHYLLHQSVNLYIIRSDSRKKSAISQNMPIFYFLPFLPTGALASLVVLLVIWLIVSSCCLWRRWCLPLILIIALVTALITAAHSGQQHFWRVCVHCYQQYCQSKLNFRKKGKQCLWLWVAHSAALTSPVLLTIIVVFIYGN